MNSATLQARQAAEAGLLEVDLPLRRVFELGDWADARAQVLLTGWTRLDAAATAAAAPAHWSQTLNRRTAPHVRSTASPRS